MLTLWLAARDPRVPWHIKALCAAIAAYAFSPIDLIPDFIPVIGYLDDVILLPLAILFAIRLLPPDLLVELRAKADLRADRPTSRSAALFIVAIWVVGAVTMIWLFWPAITDA